MEAVQRLQRLGVSPEDPATAQADTVTATELQAVRRLRGACAHLAWQRLAEGMLLHGGTEVLMQMRHEALRGMASSAPLRAELAVVAAELKDVLADSVRPPWSRVRAVDWNSESPDLLDFIARNEKVLQDQSWAGVRSRCCPGRRIFGLFHPLLPAKPLAFVNVALTRGLPTRLNDILSHAHAVPEPAADTATFYSISATQPGLAGLHVARQLLYGAVAELQAELPRVDVFATLSPVPGFRAWLKQLLRTPGLDPACISEARWDRQAIVERLFMSDEERECGFRWADALLRAISDPQQLFAPSGNADALQPVLMRLCAAYLVSKHATPGAPQHGSAAPAGEQGDGPRSVQRVRDSVAHFHFGNGAMLQAIHWRANCNAKGLEASLGMMATYRYLGERVAANADMYEASGSFAVHSSNRQLINGKAPLYGHTGRSSSHP